MSAQFPSAEEIIKGLKPEMDGLHKAVDDRFNVLRTRISDLEAARNRQGLGGSWQGDEDRGELNKALKLYIKTGNDSLLREKAMSVGSDPEGGYFVPSELASSITSTIFNSSPIRQLARIVSVENDAFEELLDKDELAASWVIETASRPETTTPEVGQLRIPVHEIYASPKVTQKLLDDAKINIDAWLTEKIGDKFGRSEATAFVSGDGIGKPRGFLSYTTAATSDATRAWGVLEHVPSERGVRFQQPRRCADLARIRLEGRLSAWRYLADEQQNHRRHAQAKGWPGQLSVVDFGRRGATRHVVRLSSARS